MSLNALTGCFKDQRTRTYRHIWQVYRFITCCRRNLNSPGFPVIPRFCTFAQTTLMKFEKIHNKGQARLFQHPALEFLTKTHPLVIWGIYLPVVIGFPYYSAYKFEFGASRIAMLFLLGMF